MGELALKKPVDKQELRRELHAAVDSYLAEGGAIERVAPGTSAYQGGQRPPPTPLFNEPRAERTPLDDVVAALDQRREAERPARQRRKTGQSRPRKQVIYDDFGEPMRVVWKE